MAKIIKVQKGTKDILPQEMNLWHKMEQNAQRIFSNAGYGEIRTPIFEATELFARGVGDTTDIVIGDGRYYRYVKVVLPANG